jgi:paraquat-inducible protein B
MALLVSGTRFWVVRPRLGATGVSGLGTLLSGAYIGMDAGTSHESVRKFAGLETPPVVAGGTAGSQFVLHSPDLGSLSIGAPAYFHHIQVGQISSLALHPHGHGLPLILSSMRPTTASSPTILVLARQRCRCGVGLNGVHTDRIPTAILPVAWRSSPGRVVATAPRRRSHFHLATNYETMKAPDRVVESYILYFESLRGLAPRGNSQLSWVDIGSGIAESRMDRANEKFCSGLACRT